MSEYLLQEFFKKEDMLNLALGPDGMLGFFASRYPTVMAMTRTIVDFKEQLAEEVDKLIDDLTDARDKLEFFDTLINQGGHLTGSDKNEYKTLKHKIEEAEKKLERKRGIVFRGKPITERDAEFRFILEVDQRFPGLMQSLCELDRLIRIPIADGASWVVDWAVTPLRVGIRLLCERFDLGMAGHLMLMLVDSYPELIRQRLSAEEASEQVNIDENELNGFTVKEHKTEVSTKIKI